MPHRERIKHYHEPGHLHEFTFSCYRRKPLLTNDCWREMLARTLDTAGQMEQLDLAAFVFMPEHLHPLVNPRSRVPDSLDNSSQNYPASKVFPSELSSKSDNTGKASGTLFSSEFLLFVSATQPRHDSSQPEIHARLPAPPVSTSISSRFLQYVGVVVVGHCVGAPIA